MSDYRRGSHTVYDIEYHFVWATKYRYHVLTGEVAVRCRELIRQSCLSRDIRIVRGHVSKDHIHILASCPPKLPPPKLSPAKIMQYLKGRSSRLLQREFPHLSERYWGRHMWARGYFCATVGGVTDEQIKEYIERHDKEPPDQDFRIG